MRRTGLIALALFCLCGQATAQSDGKHEQAVVAADKSPEAAPIYREFHDWVLACDNIRTCVARYAKAQDDGADGYLSVARDAGPKGAMRATLSYPAGGRVELDGRSAGRYPWVAVRRKGAGKQAVITDTAALQFVRAVKDGRELSYNAGGSVVSLDGLKAALSAMDEAQGRTRWGRREQPANAGPPVRIRPVWAPSRRSPFRNRSVPERRPSPKAPPPGRPKRPPIRRHCMKVRDHPSPRGRIAVQRYR